MLGLAVCNFNIRKFAYKKTVPQLPIVNYHVIIVKSVVIWIYRFWTQIIIVDNDIAWIYPYIKLSKFLLSIDTAFFYTYSEYKVKA